MKLLTYQRQFMEWIHGYFENINFQRNFINCEKISRNTKQLPNINCRWWDTIAALKINELNLKFTHLSTAGGAFLEYIEGKNLPGIEVLK